MRKRNKHISVWMNEQEYAYLKRQAALSGLGIDPFIRNLVRGVKFAPKHRIVITPYCGSCPPSETTSIRSHIGQTARGMFHRRKSMKKPFV